MIQLKFAQNLGQLNLALNKMLSKLYLLPTVLFLQNVDLPSGVILMQF